MPDFPVIGPDAQGVKTVCRVLGKEIHKDFKPVFWKYDIIRKLYTNIGKDNYELYLLEFPEKGYSLNWTATLSVGSYGQGIAHEKAGDSTLIYGIVKKENKVVVSLIDYKIK